MIIDINFACDGCGQRLVVEAAAAGLATPCPSCARELQVPDHANTYPRLRGGFTEAPASQRVNFPLPLDVAADQDLLRRELGGAHLLVQRTEHELQMVKSHLETVREEVREARSDRDRARAMSAQALEELADGQAQLQEAQAGLRYWQEHAAAQQEAEQKTAESLESAQRDLAVMHSKLAAARQNAKEAAAAKAEYEARMLALQERHEQALAAQAAAAAADFEALRQTVRKVEAELSAMAHDLAATQALLLEKAAVESLLAETQAHLRKAETAGEQALQSCADKQEEIETLKRQLSESAAGREILELRKQNEQAHKEVNRLQRSLRLSEEERQRQAAEETCLKAGLEALRLRCEEAEKQASGHDATGVEILNGIIERQKAELEEQHSALARLRRAKVGLRLVYALVAVLSIGAILAVAQVLSRLMAGEHLPSVL